MGGFGKNKETHKSNIEAKKAAKLELEDAKKTLATETSKLSEYSSAYEQSNKAYEKISEAYEAAKEKKDKAFEKYDAARTRLKEAKDNVALAESIMDLRTQLGRTDVKKVREGLEKKRAELKEEQEAFQAKADKIAKALGIDPADENLPEDKLKQYNDLIEAAFGDEGSSIINQYSVLNKQEEAIKDYEEAKTKQVEKIAENKTAKSGIGAFIGGVVARFKIPDFFGNEEDEDELNAAA